MVSDIQNFKNRWQIKCLKTDVSWQLFLLKVLTETIQGKYFIWMIAINYMIIYIREGLLLKSMVEFCFLLFVFEILVKAN